jgi:hypothetical protein
MTSRWPINFLNVLSSALVLISVDAVEPSVFAIDVDGEDLEEMDSDSEVDVDAMEVKIAVIAVIAADTIKYTLI